MPHVHLEQYRTLTHTLHSLCDFHSHLSKINKLSLSKWIQNVRFSRFWTSITFILSTNTLLDWTGFQQIFFLHKEKHCWDHNENSLTFSWSWRIFPLTISWPESALCYYLLIKFTFSLFDKQVEQQNHLHHPQIYCVTTHN